MGKKIQCLGRYTMEGQTLGKGNFARVELAHHTVTGVTVGSLAPHPLPSPPPPPPTSLFQCRLSLLFFVSVRGLLFL